MQMRSDIMPKESPKRNKNTSQIACENIANNLICAEMLNKKYVSFNTLAKAMNAKSTNAVRRLLKKMGYEKQPYEDIFNAEERAEILYETLKAFQLEGLKAYANELKTKAGKTKAKARLVRGKFPDGYKTKNKEKQQEIQRQQEQAQNEFDDDWSE